MSEGFYSLPTTYPAYQHAITVVLTVYFGVYVMISNHFIFKPKIEKFLCSSDIHSFTVQQLLIDILSTLPMLAFIFNQVVLLGTDGSLSILVFQDMFWLGIWCSLITYRSIVSDNQTSGIITGKNGIFLCCSYLVIGIHYIERYYFLSMSLLLMGIYIISFAINANEAKFIIFIDKLLGNISEDSKSMIHQPKSKFPSPEYLSRHCPVTDEEIDLEMKHYAPALASIKLKTKARVAEKLLRISLALKISREKLEEKQRREVQIYYGSVNGTINEKYKRIEFEEDQSNENIRAGQERERQRQKEAEPEQSIVFYLFPVRLFENSPVISVVFSLFINLALGFALSIMAEMGNTLPYGEYLQFIYALLLLPVLPSISQREYFNGMAISSLFKYFLLGFFLSIECGQTVLIDLTWLDNSIIGVCSLVLAAQGSLVAILILRGDSSELSILFVFVLAFLSIVVIIYKQY